MARGGTLADSAASLARRAPDTAPPLRAPRNCGCPIDRHAAELFRGLAAAWRSECAAAPAVPPTAQPTFRQIVALGRAVVPLLLAELEREPAPWFLALQAVAGEDPVPPADCDRLAALAAAWLAWGRRQGYLW